MFKLKSLVELARGPAYELKEPRGCVGPTEVACGTHQSGGSGLVQQLHRGAAPYRCVWEAVGPTQKMEKIR